MTFTESLSAAMDTRDPDEYISRVKQVVGNELRTLDTTVKLTATSNFNHSALPDFVASWPGEAGERRIYLRDSYESILAGRDEVFITDGNPILFSLLEPHSEVLRQARQAITTQAAGSTLLVTDVEAVEVLGTPQGDLGALQPLTRLIRSNFVRGARGQVDRQVAETLLSEQVDELSANRDDLIRLTFAADAATRIARAASIVDLALNSGDTETSQVRATGRLSLAELSDLLPWLLRRPDVRSNSSFWRRFGELTSLEDLERVRDSLGDLDLTPLVAANADVWTGRWAFIGTALPPSETQEDGEAPAWSFTRGALGIDLDEVRRLSIADNGQLTPKRKEGRAAARWADLVEPIRTFRLARVHLAGIRRSLTVTAEQSPDVRSDVESIAASLDDDYHVTKLAVRVDAAAGSGESVDLEVDFQGGTIRAASDAPVSALARVALEVLEYRNTADPDELARVLPPQAAEEVE